MKLKFPWILFYFYQMMLFQEFTLHLDLTGCWLAKGNLLERYKQIIYKADNICFC